MNATQLKIAMLERHKTNADLANLLGVSKPQITNIMNNKNGLSIQKAKMIIQYLNLSQEEAMKIFFDQ